MSKLTLGAVAVPLRVELAQDRPPPVWFGGLRPIIVSQRMRILTIFGILTTSPTSDWRSNSHLVVV